MEREPAVGWNDSREPQDAQRGSDSEGSRLGYLPVLDGLRAIALLSVLAFHLEPALLPGGFVGVDIFFVLSGYLITRIIHHELRAGTFSLSRFYQRRIARIAPALFVLCAIVLIVAACVYPDADLAETGSSVATTAASILNFKLIFKDNYFKLSHDTLPLLHCWSLSVEEQFYLVYPVLVWGVYRFSPRLLFPVIAVLTLLSATACVVLTPEHATYAFYLPMTRAWEMGCGGLAALSAESRRKNVSMARSTCTWGGLAVLAAAIAVTPGGRAFPGFWAFLPVVGSLLTILGAGAAPAHPKRSLPDRALASPPLVAVGRMSYSLYLWHWPVFSFIDYLLVLVAPSARIALKVLVTVVCAWVSYRVIEQPLRRRLAQPSASRLAYGAFLVGVIALFTVGFAVRRDSNLNGTTAALRRGGTRYCEAAGSPVTVLAGDSTACMFGTTVRDICRETKSTLVMAAVPGLNQLPHPSATGDNLWTLLEAIASRERPRRVIVSACWTRVLTTPEAPEQLRRCLVSILAASDRVILLQQPPVLPDEATREGMRRGGRPPFYERPETAARRRIANEAVRSLASDRVYVIDLDRYFLDETGAIRRWDPQGNDLFIDPDHVSSSGAKLVAPELREMMGSTP